MNEPATDPNNFTQKDLMQHLLHTAQHAVTREEMAAQFAQAEERNRERFEQVDKQFEQVDKQFAQAEERNRERFEQVDRQFAQVDRRFDELKAEIREQGGRHDRLVWGIFAAMLAIFFKEQIVALLVVA